MAIATEIIDDIAVIMPQGDVKLEDAVEAYRVVLQEHRAKHTLWDLTLASLSGYAAKDFLAVTNKTRPFADVRGQGARSALVAASKFDQMLLEAFRVFSQSTLDQQVKIFYDRDEAFAWLKS